MFFQQNFQIFYIYIFKIIILAKTLEMSQYSRYSPVFYLIHFEESTSTNLIVMIYFLIMTRYWYGIVFLDLIPPVIIFVQINDELFM